MPKWTWTRTAGLGGRFAVYVYNLTKTGMRTDVTRVRGLPTGVNYSSSDPFGDSTATLTFPGVTILDDLASPEFNGWLSNFANVDIYWLPAIPWSARYSTHVSPQINPLTGNIDVITPLYLRNSSGAVTSNNYVKVWEGFIASMDFNSGSGGGGLELQCQGALFQLDHYLQKPFYPARPYPLEGLIADAFSHAQKPHLRTQPLITHFPTGWTKIAQAYTGGSANVYSPVVKPGSKWTGVTTRNTGSWEHTLTGFVQDQLAVMITDNDSGVVPGNQWTINHARESATYPQGRQPILMVRDSHRAPDFSVWAAAPGVQLSLSSDSTQSANIVYGDGTDINGETWRNAVISNDGSRTDYQPLAASRLIYPPRDNLAFSKHTFASEAYVKFGSGFSQVDATSVAQQQLARDQQPGWSGSITLTVDPSPTLSRFLIRAGMTVLIKGFAGTGADGYPFHIAAVSVDVDAQSVSLTVDTRYRDLLTVAEAQARTRDPLNPVRMLQVNKTSVLVQDIQAPWDYKAGSGFIPKASTTFYAHKPNTDPFPYFSWAYKHQPLHYPQYYVKIPAAAKTSAGRWSACIPILTAEKFTIARTEAFLVDVYGRPLKYPFHLSFYSTFVTYRDMPREGNNISPYIDGAFETVNPKTGQPWDKGNFLAPNASFIIGWGNKANGIYQRAGFSPGSEVAGGNPTGVFFDDSPWNWDNTNNKDYAAYAKPGSKQQASAITIYAMFYCEAPVTAYLTGRLYRQNPGPN
jgi:hypothetical protein